jgi:hypothetical protein
VRHIALLAGWDERELTPEDESRVIEILFELLDEFLAERERLNRLAEIPQIPPASPTPREIGVPAAVPLLPIVEVGQVPPGSQPMNPPKPHPAAAELEP